MAKKKVAVSRKRPPPGAAARSFHIVGIGASAGGLEAFSTFLEHLAVDTGMGFVLVQHLDPNHESALVELLQHKTSLPIRAVTNRLRVKPNHVYVIPPNTHLGIVKGLLTVFPRPKAQTPARSIDAFFEALAADQHERSIGVVLSGTAYDGTIGLEAIKAEGGITFAQDDSARHDSMPRSAVAAGSVDFVLAPDQIARELSRIAKHPKVGATAARTAPTQPEVAPEAGFKKVLRLLRDHSGVDFSLYKSSTIERRITRRMVLSGRETLEQYAGFLRNNAKELDALYNDSLINVTNFFRNSDAFDVLQRQVWPTLLRQRGTNPVRAWVLGCSTGQEAYSIAMSFVEAAGNFPRARKLQVFATDLNEAVLDKARRGVYARHLVDDLSPERLQRFFTEEDGGYRVSKQLREMVVFARQNLIGDPPFSRMDLVSCRNLLIYLDADLQKKVFPVFHYALKAGGFLYLGGSESIAGFTDLFEPIDKKHKIYVRKTAPARALQLPLKMTGNKADAGSQAGGREPGVDRPDQAPTAFQGESNAQREADRVTLNQFAPPGVLINAELQVMQFRGSTGAFLEPPKGKASFDVLKMARSGLMLPLRAAINKARKEKKTARRENVTIEQDGVTRAVNVEVIPLLNLPERCYLVLFEDSPTAGRRAADVVPVPAPALPRGTAARRVGELESALAETRDYLQALQEAHEAANEELQSANEEVQSANEELQSLNEELETSKEELESSNEELSTFNEEIADRNAELGRVNAQLTQAKQEAVAARNHAEAILRTMRDPFLVVNADLRIESANEAFYRVFNATVNETEGRSIYDIGDGRWNTQRFRRLLEEVLPRNSYFNDLEMAYDVDGSAERTMLVNARRVVEGDGAAGRILLGINDITEVLQFQTAARNVEARYRALVEASAQIIWTADATGAMTEDSPSWREFTGQTYGQWIGWGWLDALHADERRHIHGLWLRAVESRTALSLEYRLQHASGEWRWTEARAVPVLNTDGSLREWIGSNTDISARRSRSDALSEADQQKNIFLAMLAHELRNPLAPLRNSIEIVRRIASARDPSSFSASLDTAVTMMERQVGHMARLVDDLLDVSRISRGKVTLRIERVDLSQIVREAIDAVLPAMDCKLITLHLTRPLESMYLNADPTRLTQIVGNLLHNACKFTGDGGRVEVTLEQGSDPRQVIIRVRDWGIGIAADDLPRIFGMFQQVDSSRSRSVGGLGIGLTLVKTLTEMHGGAVEAMSAGLGQGSEFVVRLPVLPDQPEPEVPAIA